MSTSERADFSTTSKALFRIIGEAGRSYTGELNTPEHHVHVRAAHDAVLVELGWTPAEWKEELTKQRQLSRLEMHERIHRLTRQETRRKHDTSRSF